MSSFSLDDIRAAADAKYGSTDIPFGKGKTAHLLNPLRMTKDNRNALIAKQEEMSAEGEVDQEQILSDCIRLICSHAPTAEALLKEVNGDLAVLMTIFEKYNEGAQVGEASASQD